MADSFLDRISPSKPVRQPSGPVVPPSDAYAAAALRGEIDKVIHAPEGTRNHTLFSSTAALCEICNAGALTVDTVRNAMTDAGRSAGLDDFEIERTIQSAFDKTEGVVRMIPERESLASVSSIDRAEKVAQNPTEKPAGSYSRFRSRMLLPTGLRQLPEPSPLIGDVLDRGSTALLYASWGVGKSFIALDWALSVSTGRQWQGRFTDRARVLYVVAEGAYGFSKRVEAWETAWKTPVSDDMIAFLPVPVNLMTDDVEALAEDITAGGYEFIVFDTLARCTVGAEENSAKDVGIVIDSMTRLVDATPDHRGVVLSIHHTGKDLKTLRGSSAYESGVDTVYFAEKESQTISLRCKKRKDGPDNDRHTLRLASIIGTDSCVVEGVTGIPDGGQAVTVVKRVFTEMFSETGVSNSELRAVVTEQGLSQSDLYRARAELINEGWLKNTGSTARPFWERNA